MMNRIDPDLGCVEKARWGELEAFGENIHLYQARIYRLALCILRERQAAQGIVQESFVAAWWQLHTLDQVQGRRRAFFSTRLYRIAIHQALLRRRRQQRQRHICLEEWMPWERSRGPPSPACTGLVWSG